MDTPAFVGASAETLKMMDGCFRGIKVRKGSGGSSGPQAAAAMLLWYISRTEVFWSGANPPRWLSCQQMGFLLSVSMGTVLMICLVYVDQMLGFVPWRQWLMKQISLWLLKVTPDLVVSSRPCYH